MRYDNAEQILTQYYTDIVIRNASGQIVTPAWRWNPLVVDWGGGSFDPPLITPNGLYSVVIQLHNSGTTAYTNDTLLSYQWQGPGGTMNDNTGVAVGSITEGNFTTVTLPVRAPSSSGVYTLRIDMIHENGGYFHDREAGRPWFTLDFEICVGSQCNQVFLPLIFKSDNPPPGNCTWEGNQLLNSAFNLGGAKPLNHWLVWIDEGPTGEFKNWDLYEGSNYYSPDSGPAGAFLGGENDVDQPDGGDNNDQYIAQSVIVEDTEEVEALRIAFSYCLVTYEQSSLEKDKFMIDLQAGTLGSRSAFPDTLTYTNLDAFSALDSNNCQHDSGQWMRRVRIANGINQKYQGDRMFTLVFYSDVNKGRPSTFYFDTTEVNICRR